MAPFNPLVSPTNDPKYDFRGTDRAQANNAFGSLFENMGNAVTSGVTAADSIIKERIREPLRKELERVRDEEFGVREATEQARDGTPPTQARGNSESALSLFNPDGSIARAPGNTGRGSPPGVTRLGAQLQSLNDAYEAGTLSQSYYMARLNAVVSQSKANNRGYEEEIDKTVQATVGVNPANNLRSSMLADLDAFNRANGSQRNQDLQFIAANAEHLFGWPTVLEDVASGRSTMNEVYQHVMTRRQQDGRRKAEDAERHSAETAGQQVAHIAERQYRERVAEHSQNFLQDFLRRTNAQEILDEWRRDPQTLTPTRRQQVMAAINQGEQQLSLELLRMGNGQDPQTGQNFRMENGRRVPILQPGQTSIAQQIRVAATEESIRNSGLAYIRQLKTALVPGGADVVTVMSQSNAVDQQIVNQGIAQAYPWMRIERGYGEVGSQELADMIRRDRRVQDQRATVSSNLVDRMLGNAGDPARANDTGRTTGTAVRRPQTANEAFQDLGVIAPTLTREQRAEVARDAVRGHVRNIVRLNASPETRAANIQYLFDRENLSLLPNNFVPTNHHAIWTQMTMPSVTDMVRQTAEQTGRPELFRNYTDWATTSVQGVLSQEAAALNTALQEDGRVKVLWDQETNRLRIRDNQNNRLQQPPRGIIDSVTKFNAALDNLQPILEANSRDPAREFPEMLRNMGATFENQRADHNPQANGGAELLRNVGRAGVPAAKKAVRVIKSLPQRRDTEEGRLNQILRFAPEDATGDLSSFLRNPENPQ